MKNEMMYRGGLFIEPKGKAGEETFNQAINGHDLRAAHRMPNVSDSRAASVREPTDNNGDCIIMATASGAAKRHVF